MNKLLIFGILCCSAFISFGGRHCYYRNASARYNRQYYINNNYNYYSGRYCYNYRYKHNHYARRNFWAGFTGAITGSLIGNAIAQPVYSQPNTVVIQQPTYIVPAPTVPVYVAPAYSVIPSIQQNVITPIPKKYIYKYD